MFGRLGHFSMAQLAQSAAGRRAGPVSDRTAAHRAFDDQTLGIFLRLLGVMGIGFCAAGAIALMTA